MWKRKVEIKIKREKSNCLSKRGSQLFILSTGEILM